MEFKRITTEQLDTAKALIHSTRELSCESACVNLLLWQDVYMNSFAFEDGQLFIRSSSEYGDCYRLPMGGDLKEGIKKLCEHLGGKLPVFWAPEGELLDSFRNLFGDSYTFEESRDAFDYIYPRSALALLSGKKYHSKRNHISAFSRKYNWTYEPITPQNIDAVKLCAEQWYSENTERLDRYLLGEKKGLFMLLSNMETLPVSGGVIKVEQKVVAFTIGSAINRDVFDIHIEKALAQYSEGYTVINREFAARLPESFTYINREDDMGLEGLRRAKLSYRPEILLKKYTCHPIE